MQTNTKLFNRCYYTFFINGIAAILVGSIMPHLISDLGLSYGLAGSLLSCFAIGNLLASFIFPPMVAKVGYKVTAVVFSSLVPLSFLTILLTPPPIVLCIALFCTGIGRGIVSNTNNAVISDYSTDATKNINILHTFFAVGAFLAPFLTSSFLSMGLSWKHVVATCTFLCITSVLTYASLPIKKETSATPLTATDADILTKAEKYAFFKERDFYIVGFILFFYLAMENCVNGWFITYLQSINVMTPTYATNLLSILWIIVIFGRLATSALSKKQSRSIIILINSVGCIVFFFLLIATKNIIVITIAMMGLGFFMGGIYPTCVATGKCLVTGSTSTVIAILLAMASLGGIIMPQLIGIIADRLDMAGAMSFLIVDVIMMGLLALGYFILTKKSTSTNRPS